MKKRPNKEIRAARRRVLQLEGKRRMWNSCWHRQKHYGPTHYERIWQFGKGGGGKMRRAEYYNKQVYEGIIENDNYEILWVVGLREENHPRLKKIQFWAWHYKVYAKKDLRIVEDKYGRRPGEQGLEVVLRRMARGMSQWAAWDREGLCQHLYDQCVMHSIATLGGDR